MTTINLTGVSYQEDFNTLGDGLPSGWAIYTDATSSSLGTLIDFNSAPKSWDNTAGGFRNVASANSELEEGDAASEQKDVSDRALGIRQTGSFGDPGAAFVLSLTDTEGFQDFQLSLEAQMLSVKNRSTSWIIDYRIGTEGDFLPLGTYDDPGKWGVTQLTTGSELLDFGDAIDNQSELVQIRVVALSDSTNSNYRDTVAIDNFSLNYSPVEDTSDPDELAPRVLAIQRPDTIDESTTEETIIYEVSFSEAVNEVDVADFSLTTTGTATANIASVSAESGTMIEVILEGVDGDGTLRLDVLPDTAMIVNDAGVALTEAFEAGDRYRIEDPTQDNETGDSNSDSDDSDVEPQPDPEADSNSDRDDSDVEPQPDPEADSDSDSDNSEADVEPEPEPTANRSSRRVINQLILGSGTEPETLIGGDGNDTIAAFDYDDVIFAQGGDNLLFGNKGNDRIYSRDGDDTLFGGQDDDLLIGGPGDTVLSGDFGNDTLSGGGGDNLFILRPESSHDVITDFNPDRDRLGLSHGLTSEDLTWTQQGNHTLIQIDRSGRAIATLQNTAANLLNPSQMLPIRYPGLE
jgi:hypothetical protein